MKKNTYEALTDGKLLERKQLLKGAAFGLGLVFLLAISILICLSAKKGFKIISIPIFPIWMLTFIPLIINIGLINKEIKARNL